MPRGQGPESVSLLQVTQWQEGMSCICGSGLAPGSGIEGAVRNQARVCGQEEVSRKGDPFCLGPVGLPSPTVPRVGSVIWSWDRMGNR